jgi:hypothetical protein
MSTNSPWILSLMKAVVVRSETRYCTLLERHLEVPSPTVPISKNRRCQRGYAAWWSRYSLSWQLSWPKKGEHHSHGMGPEDDGGWREILGREKIPDCLFARRRRTYCRCFPLALLCGASQLHGAQCPILAPATHLPHAMQSRICLSTRTATGVICCR